MAIETRDNGGTTPIATTSRRRAIAKGGAVAFGVAAGMLVSREPAAAAGTPLYGESNNGTPGVYGNNTQLAEPGSGGPGVRGDSVSGHGVLGRSDTAAGVRGIHTSPTEATGAVIGINQGAGGGVVGRAGNGPGVRGITPGVTNAGVYAQSGSQPGAVVLDGGLALLALGHTVLRPPTDADLAPDDTLAIDPSFTGPTLLVRSSTGDPAILGTNDQVNEPGNGGHGVQGSSSNGFGIQGISDTSAGVVGVHTSATQGNAALVGVNRGLGAGVDGRSEMGAGLRGNAPGANAAVLARSGSRQTGDLVLDGALAVLALGRTVLRPPTSADGTVALDPTFTGETLQVIGGARTDALFMPIGTGTIPAGARAAQVANPAAGLTSHIGVTLVGTTRRNESQPGQAVSWIARAAGSFTVNLTAAVDVDTPFTYMIVNP
jgi:hypothetical protein